MFCIRPDLDIDTATAQPLLFRKRELPKFELQDSECTGAFPDNRRSHCHKRYDYSDESKTERDYSFKRIPSSRKLLYKQYFREIDPYSSPYNALDRETPGKSFRKKIASKKKKKKSATKNKKQSKVKRKKMKINDKINSLQKKCNDITMKLNTLKRDHATTIQKIKLSKEMLHCLELQEHHLNLEYADLEDRESCIIYPL